MASHITLRSELPKGAQLPPSSAAWLRAVPEAWLRGATAPRPTEGATKPSPAPRAVSARSGRAMVAGWLEKGPANWTTDHGATGGGKVS